MVDARKYAAAGFIKIEEVKDRPMRQRIVHVAVGQYGKLDATFESGRKLGLNGTSVGALMCEFGTDTDSWPGHEVEVYAGQVKYQGNLKDAVLVRPLNGASYDEMTDTSPSASRHEQSEQPQPSKRPDPDDEIPFS
jgi:hypothetical protein